MRAFAFAIFATTVLADGHLPHDDQEGLISPSFEEEAMENWEKLSMAAGMVAKFCDEDNMNMLYEMMMKK